MEKRQISLPLLSPGCCSTAFCPLPVSHTGFHSPGTREHCRAPRGRWDGAVSRHSAHVPRGPIWSPRRGTGLQLSALGRRLLSWPFLNRLLGKASLNSVGGRPGGSSTLPSPATAPDQLLPSRASTGGCGLPLHQPGN